MAAELDDSAAMEVAVMQFAGGMTMARVAEEWEHDAAWVEEAVRRALLRTIPQREGGLKPPRAEARAERSGELTAVKELQGQMEFEL